MQKTDARVTVSSLVIWSGSLEESLSFYRALGLEFVEERHGSGPVHFSSHVGDLLLEIYRGEKAGTGMKRKEAEGIQLGLIVPNVDEVYAALIKLGVSILREPGDTLWGRSVLVADSDSRPVELIERRH